MKIRASIGLTAGLLLFVSGFAHAFGGWPPLEISMSSAGVDPRLVEAAAIGWHFGAASMCTFGLLLIWSYYGLLRGVPRPVAPALLVGLAYVAFGLYAYLARDGGVNSLFFVVAGLLAAIPIVGPQRPEEARASDKPPSDRKQEGPKD